MESEPPAPTPPPLTSRGVPPLIFQAAPPPRPGTGKGWKIAVLVLLILLGFSLIGNLKSLLGAVLGRGKLIKNHETSLEEVVIQDAETDSDDKIAVIEVKGVITGEPDRTGSSLTDDIKAQLKAAAKDHAVKAVILKVDSPGGEVLASDEIYNLISEFQLKHNGIPVVASMGGLAASGGYYISAPCQYIVANELTITGSIGVIMHGYNYRGLMDKVGVIPEIYKSGRFKDMLSGEKEPGEADPEERKMVQAMIDETYGKFTRIVAQGRGFAHEHNKNKGRSLAPDWKDYADGRILTARQAYDLGLVDQVGDFKAAVKSAKELAGIPDASLIEYEQPFDFSNLFRFLGKTEAPTLKVDLGLEMPRLQAGRPYFLLPIAAH